MLRNELEKSLIQLDWREQVENGNQEWFAGTRLYYDIKIKKVSDKHKVFGDKYYVYKVLHSGNHFLINTEDCNSLEDAKKIAWKSYVSSIECFFKV